MLKPPLSFRDNIVAGSDEIATISLDAPPRRFAPDHPLIVDLRRKDFVASVALIEDQVVTCEGTWP
jgi:hypothetical protein